jgi:hypothetical protein
VQMIPALGRDSDWHDWLADIFAVALALGGIALVRHALAPRSD